MANSTAEDQLGDAPAWLVSELPWRIRWAMSFRLAMRMAFHDRQQTIASVLGIAFAYVLVGQNVASAGHYLDQGTAPVDVSNADLWIVPPGDKSFFGGTGLLSYSAVHQASATQGVEWAAPIVRGVTVIKTPSGSAEPVIVIGARAPAFFGGPFNIVKGDKTALLKPNALFVEDTQRERLGGLNLGSSVEIGGHRARVEGLTWGLITITTSSLAFAEFDFARSILSIDSDRCSFVMVHLDGSVKPARVMEELGTRIPEATIFTTAEYRKIARHFILFDAGLIGLILMGFFTGLTVGLAIVTLSTLSSVQQNLREFGTLKAIGATNADLRRLLIFQALAWSTVGAFIGAVVLCEVSWASRSARLNMVMDPLLLTALVPFVTTIAVGAALLAIRRTNRVEPGSIFR